MKLVPLTNISGLRLKIVEARLVFEPGETKKVHPATVTHPAVQKYVSGGYLLQGNEEITNEKAEPSKKAPVPKPVATSVTMDPIQPNAETVQETVTETVETPASESGNLREIYLSAPGITDENVDAILEKFGTVAELADADKDALVELGLSKTASKKIQAWAKDQE